MNIYNDNNNDQNLTPEEKAQIMIKYLKKLGELTYSNYKTEESYRFFEQLRGKDGSGE
jgi:hypothetical protein